MARLEQIQKLLQKEPQDIFLNYSLAMEYHSAGQNDEAITQLDRTLALDGNYLPAFVKKAELLISARRFDDARSALQQGADVAHRKGDRHMLDNITQMIEMLP